MQDKDTLIARWKEAFDDINKLPGFKAQVRSTRYASNARYHVEKFTWEQFPSGGPLSDTPDLQEYGFNDQGLPIYNKFSHLKHTWEGYYSYTPELVEYVEFYMNTGTPSAITRLFFENGRKVHLQNIVINNRGNVYAHLKADRPELIKRITEYDGNFFLVDTHFEYDGRISGSKSTHITPGIGIHTSHDEYAYAGDVLDTIRIFDHLGNNRLSYSRNRENLTRDELITRLAQQIAEEIVKRLDPQVPLAYLEIVYHYEESYVPVICYLTEKDLQEKRANNEFLLTADVRDGIELTLEPFEDLFVQMENRMDEEDDKDLGRHMLRKVAAILNTSKMLPTTDDFAAIAIDPYVEEDLVNVLHLSGVSDTLIEQYIQEGRTVQP